MVGPTNPERTQIFTDYIQRYQAQLVRYIFVLVRNAEDAQDVFQRTCIVLWNKFDQFDPGQKFLAWACGVARLEAYNYLKQHRRYRTRFSEEFAQRMAEVQADSVSGEVEARRTSSIASFIFFMMWKRSKTWTASFSCSAITLRTVATCRYRQNGWIVARRR